MTDQSTSAGEGALLNERLGIAGSGAIACGLAALAAQRGDVLLWARSPESATRVRRSAEEAGAAGTVHATEQLEDLAGASFVIEAIVEDSTAKSRLLSGLDEHLAADAILATTTSSLSVQELARASGRAERFVGFHVFNPVVKMGLVELAFPDGASDGTRARTVALCEALGKTPVEVPAIPGFVVNRLLFPYLFSGVRLLEQTGMQPGQLDTCMTMGAGHPLGPLAVLDLVGLDVAEAIGVALNLDVPQRLRELVAAGALGRKSGRGFHQYG